MKKELDLVIISSPEMVPKYHKSPSGNHLEVLKEEEFEVKKSNAHKKYSIASTTSSIYVHQEIVSVIDMIKNIFIFLCMCIVYNCTNTYTFSMIQRPINLMCEKLNQYFI